MESEAVVDSTMQQKDVTYPLDTKQYRKIILRLLIRTGASAAALPQGGSRACVMAQRLRKGSRKRKAARRGQRPKIFGH